MLNLQHSIEAEVVEVTIPVVAVAAAAVHLELGPEKRVSSISKEVLTMKT